MAAGQVKSAALTGARGALIVFEGVDRSGKTTQAKQLVSQLNSSGTPAEFWRFPDRETPTGIMINDYLTNKSELDDRVVHLLFAANRWEKRALLLEKLEKGTTLIVDRYSFSGVAFSAAKQVEGLDLKWCAASEVGLPRPDAVLFMSLSPEQAAARGGFGEERYETQERQAAVRQQFALLHDASYWHTIDAGGSVAEVQARVQEVAQACLAAVADTPVGTLWTEPGSCPGSGADR